MYEGQLFFLAANFNIIKMLLPKIFKVCFQFLVHEKVNNAEYNAKVLKTSFRQKQKSLKKTTFNLGFCFLKVPARENL